MIRKMMRFLVQKKLTIAAVLLFLGAMCVRIWNIEYFPFYPDADEMADVLAGQSIVQLGVPISWSSFHYPKDLVVGDVVIPNNPPMPNVELKLVKNWFDHPYLLSIIQGWWLTLLGFSFPSTPTALIVRTPMMIFAALTLILTYKISKHLFGQAGGLVSLLIMGFSPAFIVGQRMVVGENVTIPFLLCTLYFFLQKKPVFVLIFCTILGSLSKMSGLLIIPVITYGYILRKEWKTAIAYAVASIGGVALALGIHGYAVDFTSFIWMMKAQSYRMLGWSNPSFLLTRPLFHIRPPFLDLSYYFILFLGFSFFTKKEDTTTKLLTAAILCAFCFVWITGAEQDTQGWYKLPLFTFLTIAVGGTISQGIRMMHVALFAMVVLNNIGLVRFPDHPLPSTELLRGVLAFVFAPFFFCSLFSSSFFEKIKKGAFVVISCAFIVQAFFFSKDYYRSVCKDTTCPMPNLTIRQLIIEKVLGK